MDVIGLIIGIIHHILLGKSKKYLNSIFRWVLFERDGVWAALMINSALFGRSRYVYI